MASSSDLCSLADVQAWLGNTAGPSETQISGLITSVSRTILAYLNRSYILPVKRTEVRNGNGNRKLMLREWPVLSVQSLTVDGSVITAQTSPPFGSGYIVDAASPYPPGRMGSVALPGGWFREGMANVVVVYTAGYQVTGEAWTVPATPFQITPLGPYGNWASDQGVTYANGTALAKVAGSPAVGQYSVSATGLYTFNSADATASVLISYGYVPAELKQACIESVGERFSYRTRIGIQSKTLAGQETITYSLADLTKPVKLMLNSYVAIAPL